VLFLLCYYSPSWSETFSPSVEVLDNIISDLSASIILQSSLLDEALLDASLDDMDMTEEFLSVRFFSIFKKNVKIKFSKKKCFKKNLK